MARKPKAPRRGLDDELRYDELRRELGFDELTYEHCFFELFGELFDPTARPPTGGGRVTQMGPGRRTQPKSRPRPAHEDEPEETS